MVFELIWKETKNRKGEKEMKAILRKRKKLKELLNMVESKRTRADNNFIKRHIKK